MKQSHPYTIRFLQFDTRHHETLEWIRAREARRGKLRRVGLLARLLRRK